MEWFKKMWIGFNSKPVYKNVLAVILSLISFSMLIQLWAFRLVVQYVMIEKTEWLNPLDRSTWIIRKNYPNLIYFVYFSTEATLLNQIELLRVTYNIEYSNVDFNFDAKPEDRKKD